MGESFWDVPGNWYKGNLHAHSDQSDGAQSVAEAVARYQAGGYDFLAITDHNVLANASAFTTDSFLTIPGEEISAGCTLLGGDVHILGINLPEPVALSERRTAQQYIDQIKRLGGEAIVAHPYWSGLSCDDLCSLEGCLGIEVFNSSCQFSIGKGGSEPHWDGMLMRRRGAFGFANDDCHNHFNAHRPTDVAVAWNMVKAEELTVPAIMAALKRGHFYSSWGPEIKDVRFEGGTIHVETSSAKEITIHANPGRGCGETFIALEGLITSASYKTRGSETYLRVEVVDELNRKAWSNPVFL